MKIYVNNKKISDTIVKDEDLHPDLAKIITCFEINTSEENHLFVIVNSKSLNIDLNRYNSNCLSLHVVHEDVTIMGKMIKRADDEASLAGQTLDIRKFVDSVSKANPKNAFDTLYVNKDLGNCPCKM